MSSSSEHVDLLFLIEQATLMSLAGIFLTAFVLQTLVAERQTPRRLKHSNFKWWHHRFGMGISLLLLVEATDMWARHGFLTFNVLFYLSINTTTLLLGTVLTYAYSSGKAYYEGTHLTVRFPKWVRTAGGIFFAMTLVLANVIYAVAMRVDRFWYTGLFLLWLAVMLLCIGLYALGVTFQVTDALDRLATGTRTSWSAQETSKKIQKIKRRGYLVFGLLCVAVIFQLMASIARLSDRKATFEYPDNTTFDLNDRYFHYLQYFATALCLWASWMPLKGDGRYDRLPSNKW